MIAKPANPAVDPVVETAMEHRPAEGLRERRTPQEHKPALQSHEPPSLWSRLLTWLVVAGIAGGAWYYRAVWLPWFTHQSAVAGAAGGKGGPRVVPVRTAVTEQRDLPLYIKGLGTVTAFKTVTLHSRVDGELIKVAFTEGQMVNEGDLLAQIDPRPFQAQLKQAEGTLSKDKATLDLAKITLERGKELIRKSSIAQQQLDEEAAQVEALEGTVETDQALVDNARLQLSYCKIVAPITGRIGLRLVDPGNIIHASDMLGMAVITQLQPIALVFPISQDDIPKVQAQLNAGATLEVAAFSRDFQTRLAAGTLAAIDNVVDPTTGTVKLKAIFENRDNMLFPNQFVNARLHYDTLRSAIIVPSAAVTRGTPKGSFVYVVDSDETAKLRIVVPGETVEGDTQIVSGLSAGEIVVTDGLDKLSSKPEGTKVTTREKEKEKEKQREAAGAQNSQAAESAAGPASGATAKANDPGSRSSSAQQPE